MTCNGDCQQGRTCNCECKMTKDEALKLIEQKYIETFNKNPDANTKMMMQMSVQRVADGEKFQWEDKGQWEVMRFLK